MRDSRDYWSGLHPLEGEWFEATWKLPEGSHNGEQRPFHAGGPFQCEYSDEDAVRGLTWTGHWSQWFKRKHYRFLRVKRKGQL